jgi:acyl carrier protein
MNSLEDQVIRWVREVSEGDGRAEALNAESALLDNGLLDSMKVVRLVGLIEDHLGFPLPEDEISAENFESPKHIASLIRRLG